HRQGLLASSACETGKFHATLAYRRDSARFGQRASLSCQPDTGVDVLLSISLFRPECCSMRIKDNCSSSWRAFHMRQVLRIAFVASCLFAANPCFAQAGGEVQDVNVTHFVSSIGAPTPPDEIELRLRVVDEKGHEFRAVIDSRNTCAHDVLFGREYHCSSDLKDGAKRWLAGGEGRRLLL